VTTAGVLEDIDIVADMSLSLATGFGNSASYQLGLDDSKQGFELSAIGAASFPDRLPMQRVFHQELQSSLSNITITWRPYITLMVKVIVSL
jgi:hypothetical protein